MLKLPELSVITTTFNRHKELINVIELVKKQKANYEHIVISDGFDDEVIDICNFFKIKGKCIERNLNQGKSKGHFAKDVGIELASGQYICLWDDDNHYYDDALYNFSKSIKNYEIAIHKIHYYKKHRDLNDKVLNIMPKEEKIICGDIDTMNFCVSRKLASKFKWCDYMLYEGDFFWLSKLIESTDKINFQDHLVGIKL